MGEKSVFLEWSIENFSCWNIYTHGNEIYCRLLSCESCIARLYPRGVGGDEENLVMVLSGYNLDYDLSFNGLDGFSVRPNPVTFSMGGRAPILADLDDKLVKGPKFEEIINQIKRKEDPHMDVLNIRFLERNRNLEVFHVRTVIDVFDTSLKINSETFKDCHLKTDSWYLFSTIDYPPTDKFRRRFELYFSETRSASGKESLNFKVYPSTLANRSTLVKICISTINGYGQVRKHEEEHLFWTNEDWINAKSVPKEGKGYHALIGLKIVPGTFHNYMQTTDRKYKVATNTWENLCAQEKSLNPVTSNQSDNSVDALTKDFMCLYQDQDFSDITLKCDNVSFPVHRAILSARSPVFKTMFSIDMKEAGSGKVEIGDLDPSTLSRFLTYLYTGTVEDLQGESALKLYYAADKYQVPTLRKECCDFLCDNVSIDNVCDILSFADKYQDDKLTCVAHDFILENYNDVLKSKEWESLMKNEPFLAAKTVTHFAQSDHVGKIN